MRPQDLFGAAPKTVLNKPFFHAQDQKAYNVDGGTSIADAWTKRALNTVIHNDIQGASLASDAVNLPAGVYYVEAEAVHFTDNTVLTNVALALFKDGTKNITGIPRHTSSSLVQMSPTVSGVITLSSPGVVDVRYFAGTARATTGLGVSNNAGSITDASIPSIYADLKIWQLSGSIETP